MPDLLNWFVLLGPLLALLGWGLSIYNRLVKGRNFVDDAWSGIEVQLRRRHNLIPELSKLIHRNQRQTAIGDSPNELGELTDSQFTATNASGEMRTQAEVLAKLRKQLESDSTSQADSKIGETLQKLDSLESSIEQARRYFNGTAREYNTLVESFPASLIASRFGFLQAEFFELEDDEESNPGAG